LDITNKSIVLDVTLNGQTKTLAKKMQYGQNPNQSLRLWVQVDPDDHGMTNDMWTEKVLSKDKSFEKTINWVRPILTYSFTVPILCDNK
ncbi:MAG: hypothetical protein KBD63_02135, partial [Bacteriovoracaceae bacterium]|nr:hypothetical protein [Bacteriovoracaceae bacterium]